MLEGLLDIVSYHGTFTCDIIPTEGSIGPPVSYTHLPYFGSSEWLRFDVVHPAVLAEKYDRNYRPYFLGERGAASLNQYFGMQQILPEYKDNTAVYVVSPQWFTKKGYDCLLYTSRCV